MKRKLRAVFIIDDLGLGGAQRQLVEILKGFPRERWELFCVSLSEEKAAYRDVLREAGIPLMEIAHQGKWSWGTLFRLTGHLRKVKPDLVYTWLFTSEMYGRIAAVLAGVPSRITAMRNTIDDMPPRYRRVSKALLGITDRITVNVEAIRKGMVEIWKIPSDRIVTIYNGIDLKGFPAVTDARKFRETMGVPPGAVVIGMAARLARQKDHATLVDAAAIVIREFPRAHFVFAGDGPLRPEIENQIREKGIGRHMHLLGARRDVWELMNGFDIKVLSTHFEGCSNVIMEGMAAAKPVIATRAGGNAELVSHGVTGFIVPHQDAGALAARILELLQDPARAVAMGRAGRERVEREFSITRTIEKTEALFLEVLAAHGRKPGV